MVAPANEKMTLAEKLAHIGKRIGAIKKTGKNIKQNYNYIEYGVVAEKIRELFDEYKIVIIPTVKDYSVDEVVYKNGNKGYHYSLKMAFQIINGEDSDETITAEWMGEGIDSGDKGINKAETSGTKYFLMRLFNISEKGEEDADAKSPELQATKPKKVFKNKTLNLEDAIKSIGQAKSMKELRVVYTMLGELKDNPEVVTKIDEMKAQLAEVVTPDRGGDGVE